MPFGYFMKDGKENFGRYLGSVLNRTAVLERAKAFVEEYRVPWVDAHVQLGHREVLYLAVLRSLYTDMASTMATPVYTSTKREYMYLFSHTLSNTCCHLFS